MDKFNIFLKLLSIVVMLLSITYPALALEPEVVERQSPKASKALIERIRKDKWIAYRMARDPWIGKAAVACPDIVAAICAHPGPARMVAKHRRVYEIAEGDHYLCRRLTRWKGATWALIRNKYADRVIALDPEGIYRAIKRDPKVARVLARHQMFDQMVVENPDLGEFIAKHM